MLARKNIPYRMCCSCGILNEYADQNGPSDVCNSQDMHIINSLEYDEDIFKTSDIETVENGWLLDVPSIPLLDLFFGDEDSCQTENQ